MKYNTVMIIMYLRHSLSRLINRLSMPFNRNDSYTYVALGDSTVEGIGATSPSRSYTSIIYFHLKSQIKNAKYYNFGKSGARVKEVIDNQLELLVPLNPQLVTLSIGANDIIKNSKISDFKIHIYYLLDQIKRQTNATIIINSIPNFSLTPAVPKAFRLIADFQIKRFNKCIKEAAEKLDIVFIDTYRQSSVYAAAFPETITADDNFHPSDFGYAIWANTIMTTIFGLVFPNHV